MYWENGVFAQYSFENFNQINFFMVLICIIQIGSAFSSNAIKQDSYLTSELAFNKTNSYHFVTRRRLLYSDLEEDMFKEIPNTAFLFFARGWFCIYDFKKLPISLNVGTGYYIITEKDGYSPGTHNHFTFTLIFITHFKTEKQ
jgi:hypothetical protein